MENRDRDKMDKESNIGSSENWDSEPSRSDSDSSSWQGDSGRSSGSSSNVGEQSSNESTRRDRSKLEH